MRLAAVSADATSRTTATTRAHYKPPLWPPLLATRGLGSNSSPHSHHAMHLVLACEGELSIRVGTAKAKRAAGVLTAPDVTHAISAVGQEVLLVFFDPESKAGQALAGSFDPPMRLLSSRERDLLIRDAEPASIMQNGGVAWTERVVHVISGSTLRTPRRVHPRVRRALSLLHEAEVDGEVSLESLSRKLALSPGRLMHAFTESIGIPLRPYLAWLRLQRAAAAIVTGMPLVHAAHAAGFSDAPHMTRTFRRMLGMPPSALAPKKKQ